MITKTIYLDTWHPAETTVTVQQGEMDARFLDVHLLSNGTPVNLTGCTAAICGVKPDGKVIFNACRITGAAAGLVTVPMTQQMSIAPGQMKDVELRVVGNGTLLKLQGLRIIIRATADYDAAVESTGEFTALQEALDQVRDLQAYTNGQIAEAVAAYMEEHPATVELDATLTVEGKAADAKAVGDAISQLSTQKVNPVKKTEDMTQPVGVDESGKLFTKPGESIDTNYILPIGGDNLGGVKNGGNVVINADGTMTAPTSGGSAVTVDAEISDTSENPVQNKVVKAYIDAAISGSWLEVY